MPSTGFYGSFGSTTAPGSATCPAGSVAIGYDGRASTGYVFGLALRCTPLLVNGSSSTGYAFALGTVTTTTTLGGPGGTAFGATDCAAGNITSGVAIRAGEALDNYGMRCSNVALSY
jgi:hypothetical protein